MDNCRVLVQKDRKRKIFILPYRISLLLDCRLQKAPCFLFLLILDFETFGLSLYMHKKNAA